MQLGWVDFSKADREKVLDVMNLLQEQGAVDEIGIGLIRDAFANYFFPGTSTVQTRAKYFFIVSYILQEAVTGKYGNQVAAVLQKIDSEEKDCGIAVLCLPTIISFNIASFPSAIFSLIYVFTTSWHESTPPFKDIVDGEWIFISKNNKIALPKVEIFVHKSSTH